MILSIIAKCCFLVFTHDRYLLFIIIILLFGNLVPVAIVCIFCACSIFVFFVSPELSSVRDYVITHSVRSMYVVCVCMYVVICKIDHCIHIHWCIVMGLGHNDPWVESHMWPQQTWGQRSSRGQWPLVQVFGKKGQCIHILWCIFKSIKYYNDCKSMWSRKQARLVVREPPCYIPLPI